MRTPEPVVLSIHSPVIDRLQFCLQVVHGSSTYCIGDRGDTISDTIIDKMGRDAGRPGWVIIICFNQVCLPPGMLRHDERAAAAGRHDAIPF